MEWVDGNLGSKLTMKYPAIWLMGERAHGEVLSIAFAGKGQHQDAGGKVVHVAPQHDVGDHLEVDLEGRRPRRLPRAARGREGRDGREVEGRLRRADPRRGVALRHVPVHPDRRERRRHRPRGDGLEDRRGAALLPDVAAASPRPRRRAMIVSGFVEPITKELPLEYAVEMNRLIQLQMEGSVG